MVSKSAARESPERRRLRFARTLDGEGQRAVRKQEVEREAWRFRTDAVLQLEVVQAAQKARIPCAVWTYPARAAVSFLAAAPERREE